MTNPRDMIELQNELYWQRSWWNNQLVPQSDWSSTETTELRKYWGWNEVPVAKAVVNDAGSWDAIIIKLPADACQRSQWGVDDDPSCLTSDAQEQLEKDLDQYVTGGKLKVGGEHANQRPGSYVLFVREYADTSMNWQRQFFCSGWISPNSKYQVVHSNPGQSDSACYIDWAPAPDPPPSPATSPAPSSSTGSIMNLPTGKCLQADDAVNGQGVFAVSCDGGQGQQWIFNDGQFTHGEFCLDGGFDEKAGDALFLWDCNGEDQQQWDFGGDGPAVHLHSKQNMCMDLLDGDSVVQLWHCYSGNNQQWSLVVPEPALTLV